MRRLAESQLLQHTKVAAEHAIAIGAIFDLVHGNPVLSVQRIPVPNLAEKGASEKDIKVKDAAIYEPPPSQSVEVTTLPHVPPSTSSRTEEAPLALFVKGLLPSLSDEAAAIADGDAAKGKRSRASQLRRSGRFAGKPSPSLRGEEATPELFIGMYPSQDLGNYPAKASASQLLLGKRREPELRGQWPSAAKAEATAPWPLLTVERLGGSRLVEPAAEPHPEPRPDAPSPSSDKAGATMLPRLVRQGGIAASAPLLGRGPRLQSVGPLL